MHNPIGARAGPPGRPKETKPRTDALRRRPLRQERDRWVQARNAPRPEEAAVEAPSILRFAGQVVLVVVLLLLAIFVPALVAGFRGRLAALRGGAPGGAPLARGDGETGNAAIRHHFEDPCAVTPMGRVPVACHATGGWEATFANRSLANRNFAEDGRDWSDVDAGEDVEVMRGNIVRNEATQAGLVALSTAVLQRFPGATYEIVLDRYELPCINITAPDRSWWVQVATDPSSLELQDKPMTLAEYRAAQPELEAFFEEARRLDMPPDSALRPPLLAFRAGGGHMHIGLDTFDNARHLLRYVNDQQNHPELVLGTFANYPRNAAPLAVQSEAQRQALQRINQELDGELDAMTPVQLRDILNEEVFYDTLDQTIAPPRKYQATAFNHEETIELRGRRPPDTADEFVRRFEFELNRIEQLRDLDVPFQAPVVPVCSWARDGCLFDERPDRVQWIIDRTYDYIAETGYDWEEDAWLVDPNIHEAIAQGRYLHPGRERPEAPLNPPV